MSRQQCEKRIRELWAALPKERREGLVDVIVFKSDLVRNFPGLFIGVEGNLLAYVKGVLKGSD